MDVFENRIDAGNQLAEKLIKYKDKKDTIILGIPRGGVEVAFVISQKLNLPLSVITINIIKKEMPSKIIVAVPVADINILPQINADEIICILTPNYLGSISEFS